LVLFPDAPKPEQREMLFLVETNDLIARWEGAKLSKDEARALTGIQSIHWLSDFERVLRDVMAHAHHVYLLNHEHIRRHNPVETREDRFGADLRRRFPNHEYERSAPALNALRAVKDPEEVEIMQVAADITAAGYDRVLRFLKPGVWEYELEAEFLHEFVRRRSHGFAYTPIIGSGANACVLHYITNDAPVRDGDLVLFDVGAVYGNYACDVTRCFPANGRFTPRQRQVYEAVLRVEKAAMNLLKPGVRLPDYHAQVGELMTEELIGLGLITRDDVAKQDPAWPAYKKYFMHGTSHYLGLDVHDYGPWDGSEIKEGMVFTVEPGIYIPEEGLGIRIEDDVVVTKGEPINLTKAIPKEVDEIERIMAQR
ncbi:MAG: aminopeptidase P N-terminal domain-containing protein, partial [Bacteroidota bacterium]